MKKYTATVTISGTYTFQVQAEDQDEAYDLAEDNFAMPEKVQFWDTELEIAEEE